MNDNLANLAQSSLRQLIGSSSDISNALSSEVILQRDAASITLSAYNIKAIGYTKLT